MKSARMLMATLSVVVAVDEDGPGSADVLIVLEDERGHQFAHRVDEARTWALIAALAEAHATADELNQKRHLA